MGAKISMPADSGSQQERATNPTGTSAGVHYDPLVVALIVITFTTGLVNAVSYLGLGRVFTANMTGNVILFQDLLPLVFPDYLSPVV